MGKLIVRQIRGQILTILDEDIDNQDGTLGCFKILGEVLWKQACILAQLWTMHAIPGACHMADYASKSFACRIA